jgi:hypothetical protein
MASRVSQIITEAQQLANRVDASYNPRLLSAVNRAQIHWAERLPWPGLERIETFFANGRRDVVLPDRVNIIITVGDAANNSWVEPGENFEARWDPLFFAGTAGRPCEWRPSGVTPVITQPQTESPLRLLSSQSEALSVLVRGLVRDSAASGTALEFHQEEEVVSLGSSTTEVTSTSFVEILAVEKPHNTVSSLSVFDNVTGAIIGRISPWETVSRYKKLSTPLIVPAGHPLQVRFYAYPPNLTSIDQTVEASVPDDFLVWRTAGDLYMIENMPDAAQLAWAKAEEVLTNSINARRSFGQRDATAMPDSNYLDWSDYDLPIY